MALNLNQFAPRSRYDDKARLNGVEVKVYRERLEDGSVIDTMKLIDNKRRYVEVIHSMSEYKEYCLKYYA